MSTFYDSPNDYRNYLCHYGVKGMRWRNRSRRTDDLHNPNRWDYTGAHRDLDNDTASHISTGSSGASRSMSGGRQGGGINTLPTSKPGRGKDLKRIVNAGVGEHSSRNHRIQENDHAHDENRRAQDERDREAKRRQDADRRANSGLSNSKSLYQARRTKYGLNKLVNTRKNGHRR